ncbi:MAG: hypothetical protein ACT4PI_18640 [Actinomycetota bacterium]
MRRVVVLAVAVGVLATAITIAVVRSREHRQPTGVFGPGTEIGDGFTVAAGTVLLGTRFPLPPRHDPRQPKTWIAFLLVEGDPGDALSDYAAQAAKAGLSVHTSASACYRSELDYVDCSLGAEAGPWNSPAGRSLDVRLAHSDADGDEPFASHLVLRYSSWGDPAAIPSTPIMPAPELPIDVRFGPRPNPPELPESGEPIAPHLQPSWDLHTIEVEAGSELLAPPSPLHCDAQPGFDAILRVTADPHKVLTRYAEQFDQGFPRGLELERHELDQHELEMVQVVGLGDSGFGNVDVTAVTVPSGETYFWIERCGD